jgi:hypothetical protein
VERSPIIDELPWGESPARVRLKGLVERRSFEPEHVHGLTRAIRRTMLEESRFLQRGNFGALSREDLSLLFDLYDGAFLDGCFRELRESGEIELGFRVSRTMTRSGGKTKRFEHRFGGAPSTHTSYQIAVSEPLLYETFERDEREIEVAGLPCRDRLDALQRVLEHEIVHLCELVVWERSSCSAPGFREIAGRLFGHTDVVHRLITPAERALTDFGIRPGDRVAFDIDGTRHAGFVNRITKRATVLVEDRAGGVPYSDGKRYRKYYVPLPSLHRLGEDV